MGIVTWNIPCRLWQQQEQQSHLSDCRWYEYWGRWMALAGQSPVCGSCLLRGISDIERMACVCSSLLSREQVSSLSPKLCPRCCQHPQRPFSFHSWSSIEVAHPLLSHLPRCRQVGLGYFLKGCLVCLHPTRLGDPRAWRAHLGMQTQGHAKFVSSVRRIVIHEYYNSRNYDYDIALLQLSKPWPDTMSHVIQPICVPPFSHKVRSGDKCWITGWGQKQEAGEFYSWSWTKLFVCFSPGEQQPSEL